MPTKLIFLLLSLLFTSWFAFITPVDRFVDPDAFYHITVARLIYEQGPLTEFPWLDLTTLGANYADQHFLFHVLQIPFLFFLDPLRASQISSIFFAVICMLGIAYTFYKLKLNHWWLWPILLIFTQPFTTRLIQGKASPLAILLWFTAVCIVLLFLRRDKPCMPLEDTRRRCGVYPRGDLTDCSFDHSIKTGNASTDKHKVYPYEVSIGIFIIALTSFLFTLTHGGWLLLPISIILILVSDYSYQHLLSKEAGRIRRNQSTISLVPQHLLSKGSPPSNDGEAGRIRRNYFILSTLSASLLAILIHPNRNQLFSFLKVQIFDVAIATPQALRLGTEWNSANIESSISIFGIFGIIILLTAIAHISSKNFVRSTPALSEVEGMYARPERRRRDVRSVIILIPLSLLIFLASLKSLRFAEYFQPLLALQTALLASTINWKQFLKTLHLPLPEFSITSSSKLKFLYDVRRTPALRVVEGMYEWLFPSIIFLATLSITLQHSLSAYTSTHHAKRFLADQYQIPMQAISAIANPGDRVYHSMWDEFPILFFHDQNLRYVSGMDPTFLYKADPDLAMAYQDLAYNTSTTAEMAYDFIHNRLQARFIIIDHERWPALANLIATDPRYTFLAEGNGAKSYIVSNP